MKWWNLCFVDGAAAPVNAYIYCILRRDTGVLWANCRVFRIIELFDGSALQISILAAIDAVFVTAVCRTRCFSFVRRHVRDHITVAVAWAEKTFRLSGRSDFKISEINVLLWEQRASSLVSHWNRIFINLYSAALRFAGLHRWCIFVSSAAKNKKSDE